MLGWNGITLDSSATNRTGTMYCKEDYSRNCQIKPRTISTTSLIQEAWQCDTSGDLFCNDVPTLAPTKAPTFNPTLSMILFCTL